jgi:1-acyl-sn-glycerol-3-phosphate acyltransferase
MTTPAPESSMDASRETGSRPEMDPIQKSRFWRFCRSLAYFGSIVLFDYKAFGVNNVPKTGGALMISNHQSYLDPVMLGLNLPRPLSYLAKSELFKNKYLEWLITELRAFPVRQGKGDKAAIEETIRRLRQGHLLNIFPEGTRTHDGKIGPMQRGAALVVRRAGVPIVPVAIHGSYEAWPHGRKMFRSRPIRVLYGKPLHVEGLKSEQIVELMDRTLREMFEDLRAGRVAKYLK